MLNNESMSPQVNYNALVSQGRELVQYRQKAEITREQLDGILLARMLNTANDSLDREVFNHQTAAAFDRRLKFLATAQARNDGKPGVCDTDIPRRYFLVPIEELGFAIKLYQTNRGQYPATLLRDFTTDQPVFFPHAPPDVMARMRTETLKRIYTKHLNP